jgi:hypothetical protein
MVQLEKRELRLLISCLMENQNARRLASVGVKANMHKLCSEGMCHLFGSLSAPDALAAAEYTPFLERKWQINGVFH